MKKYFVINPWVQGQKKGDTFEAETLHVCLTDHVIEKPEKSEPELVVNPAKPKK